MKYYGHIITNYPNDEEDITETATPLFKEHLLTWINGHISDKDATSWVITIGALRHRK